MSIRIRRSPAKTGLTTVLTGGVVLALLASLQVGITTPAVAADARPRIQKTASAKVKVPHGKAFVVNDETRAAAKAGSKPSWPKPGTRNSIDLTKSWSKLSDAGVRLRSPKLAEPLEADVVVRKRLGGPSSVVGLELEIKTQVAELAGSDSSSRRKAQDQAPDSAVDVRVDYSEFATAFGGEWASRLRLSLGSCLADKSQSADSCDASDDLRSTNDPTAKTVTAKLPASAFSSTGAASVTLLADAAGSKGDYSASPLASSSSWSAGAQTGDFSWSYPFTAPGSVSGPKPELGLSYSSGSVDGRTSSTNNQTSWVGEGFSLDPGFVERTYVPCSEDKTDSNAPSGVGDLCWRDDNLTMSLNGKSTTLLRVGDSDVWRSQEDDGTKIERKTGASNTARGGEYWVATTTDGTRYYFGITRRYSGDGASTDSVSTVPVYGNQAGEPCHESSFSSSRCRQAWRWSIDYVRDTHDNTMTYFWDQESNKYGANKNDNVVDYDRAPLLKSVAYGTRAGTEGTGPAPAQMLFTASERCIPTSDEPCDAISESNASHWPDVPFDRICKSDTSCSLRWSPAFFSTKRLAAVTTQVWNPTSGAFESVDQWNLAQSFPGSGDGTDRSLWLKQISRSGKVGTDITTPPVVFAGAQMENRVDAIGDGIAPFVKWRVVGISNGYGGVTSVNYTGQDCSATSKPSESQLDSNTRRCFPTWYMPEHDTERQLEFFHKYLVTSVTEGDSTGTAPPVSTYYTYGGSPAWHYDETKLVRAKYRTWNDWRGYQRVAARTGDVAAQASSSETFYLRGMDGDRTDSGGTKSVSVGDTAAGIPMIDDLPHYNGFVRSTRRTDGVGGAIVDVTINTPWRSPSHASGGGLEARMVRTAETETRTRLADNSYRTAKTKTTFDDDGLATKVEDYGDTSVASDNLCTTTSYVSNPAKWLIGLPTEQTTIGGGCGGTPTSEEDVVESIRTYYDGGGLGATPTVGEVSKTASASGLTGSTIEYQADATSTYDSYGRVTSVTDATGNTSATAYEPTMGIPIKATVTNPLGQSSTTTLNRAWGSPNRQVAESGAITDFAYDSLGRTTSVWAPGRSKDAGKSATAKYVYTINTTAPSVVRTDTLRSDTAYNSAFSFYDGLLRERSTQTPAAGAAGGRLIAETRYDERGWVSSTRGPSFNSAAPSATMVMTEDNQTAAYNEITYDRVGRPTVEVFNSEGVERWRTTTTYGGDRVMVKQPQGGTSTTTLLDARDRKTRLLQHKGADPSGAADETTYTYTPAGKLKTTTNAAGTKWSNSYDIRGNRITDRDPDKGTTTTTFDILDRPTATTNAKNQTVWTKYDVLGRKTELRDDNSTGTLRSSWAYDTVKPGLLTSSTRYVGTDAYVNEVTAYDAADRPTAARTVIPASEGLLSRAGGYVSGTVYNPTGTIKSRTIPAAPALATETPNYSYDNLGNLNSFSGSGSFIAATTRSPYGEVLMRDMGPTLGKTIYDNREYEKGSRRLVRHSASLQGTATAPKIDLRYTYDAAGNVTRLNDVFAGDAAQSSASTDRQCFAYDYLRRLKTAWSSSTTTCAPATDTTLGTVAPYWDAYEYSLSGNRTKWVEKTKPAATLLTTTHNYGYGAATAVRPHALNSETATGSAPSSETFTTDDVGNMSERSKSATSGQTIVWDAEGHEKSVTDKATGKKTEYLYDADGNRLIKRDQAGASTTLYIGGGETEYELKAGAVTARRNYSVDGEPIATRITGKVMILIGDHHNSGQVEIDSTTLAVTKRRMGPFGVTRTAGAWTAPRGFLNKIADGSTGTTHLDAREYDPKLGRFLSVDPILDTNDPQQMNGYAYANNSPVTSSDPTGLWNSPGAWTSHPDQMDWVNPDHRQRDPHAYNPVDPLGRPKPKPESSKVPVGGFKDIVGSVASVATGAIDLVANAAQLRTPFSSNYNPYSTNWMIKQFDLNPLSYLWSMTDAGLLLVSLTTISSTKAGSAAGAARSEPAGVAAKSSGGLIRVGDFGSDTAAFRHYSKHVKGIVLGKNGSATLKAGGADMPEFSNFAQYRSAARGLMGGGARPGVIERGRGTDILRVDPSTGHFGVRSQDGTIRTFFRPDGDPVDYFWNQ